MIWYCAGYICEGPIIRSDGERGEVPQFACRSINAWQRPLSPIWPFIMPALRCSNVLPCALWRMSVKKKRPCRRIELIL